MITIFKYGTDCIAGEGESLIEALNEAKMLGYEFNETPDCFDTHVRTIGNFYYTFNYDDVYKTYRA